MSLLCRTTVFSQPPPPHQYKKVCIWASKQEVVTSHFSHIKRRRDAKRDVNRNKNTSATYNAGIFPKRHLVFTQWLKFPLCLSVCLIQSAFFNTAAFKHLRVWQKEVPKFRKGSFRNILVLLFFLFFCFHWCDNLFKCYFYTCFIFLFFLSFHNRTTHEALTGSVIRCSEVRRLFGEGGAADKTLPRLERSSRRSFPAAASLVFSGRSSAVWAQRGDPRCGRRPPRCIFNIVTPQTFRNDAVDNTTPLS